MNRAIDWFAKNPVAANLLMVLILAAGLVTAFTIELEATNGNRTHAAAKLGISRRTLQLKMKRYGLQDRT